MRKITLLLSIIACTILTSKSFAASSLPVTVDLSTSVANGWTYISNDPTNYPSPSFYTTAGALGLKLNYEQMGLLSPEFTPASSVSVTLNVNALNQNTKTGTSTNYFTIKGLDASGNTIATVYFTKIVKGANAVTLSGTDIVKVQIIMTGYPNDGTKYCNVNLASATVDVAPTNGINTPSANKLSVSVSNNKLTITDAPSNAVEIFNTTGAKVVASQLINGSMNLNLAKGAYIVRSGNATAKIIL